MLLFLDVFIVYENALKIKKKSERFAFIGELCYSVKKI